jgi:hypothetical protein
MKERLIAIVSIAWMLFAASAVLFDRPLFAYAIALIYAAMRWKLSEKQLLTVGSQAVLWLVRAFLVICCIIFAASGGSLGSGFEKINPIFGGVFAFIGFALAFDAGRCLKRVEVAKTQ